MRKGYNFFIQNFQSIISLHMLKLVFNKSMHASDNEQGINKLRPNFVILFSPEKFEKENNNF